MSKPIAKGTRVLARSAFNKDHDRVAASEIVMGGDFEVVWVVEPEEWEAANAEGRDPEGTPWPAEDVVPA